MLHRIKNQHQSARTRTLALAYGSENLHSSLSLLISFWCLLGFCLDTGFKEAWEKPSMDRYEVIKDIGSGNFGFAKLVRDKSTGQLFACKYIERGPKVTFYLC